MIKVTLTFLLDEENDPEIKEVHKHTPKRAFFEDRIADDYMPDLLMKAFRPYGYRYIDDLDWKYKLNHK